jgi:hypothetical protein
MRAAVEPFGVWGARTPLAMVLNAATMPLKSLVIRIYFEQTE